MLDVESVGSKGIILEFPLYIRIEDNRSKKTKCVF